MRKEFRSYCHEGALPHIVINNRYNMTLEEFLGVLERILESIKSGAELTCVDSTTIGDKYTRCSWGTCSFDKDHFPYPELQLFPQDFVDEGRVAPLEEPEGAHCPLRQRKPGDSPSVCSSGCFYQCRVFQPDRVTPSREEAIQIYEEAIRQLKAKLAIKTS